VIVNKTLCLFGCRKISDGPGGLERYKSPGFHDKCHLPALATLAFCTRFSTPDIVEPGKAFLARTTNFPK
jgi:hypothetical protein